MEPKTPQVGPGAIHLHKDRLDTEFAGRPPILKLSYLYQHPFAKMTDAYLKRYNWEDRLQLTTIANVEQVDNDNIVYYRRQENLLLQDNAWERVTVNRATQSMVAENIARNADGSESLLEKHTLVADGSKTLDELQVFQGYAKSGKVDAFKEHVWKTLLAIKFDAFDNEE